MKAKFWDVAEILLILLLLASSYTGFFFVGCVIMNLTNIEFTPITLVLLFFAGVSATHGILRFLSNVQEKQRLMEYVEHCRKKN